MMRYQFVWCPIFGLRFEPFALPVPSKKVTGKREKQSKQYHY